MYFSCDLKNPIPISIQVDGYVSYNPNNPSPISIQVESYVSYNPNNPKPYWYPSGRLCLLLSQQSLSLLLS